MARPTRLDLEGGWYHVLNRGIDRRTIFKSSDCYSHIVELLSRLPKRFGVRIHGYILKGQQRQAILISEAQHCQCFRAGLPQMLLVELFLYFLRVNRYMQYALCEYPTTYV